MNRLTLLTALIFGLGLSLDCPRSRAADTKVDAVAREHCIKACNACLQACRECAVRGDCPECDRACLTCIETCRTCVALLEFDSPLAKEMCRVCEEACKQCADECIKMRDMPHARRCAEECRKCQDACKAVTMM